MIISKNIYFHTFDNKENIVMNTVTGAIDIINLELCEALYNNNLAFISDLDSKMLSNLMRRGYVYTDEEQQKKILKKVKKQYDEFRFNESIKISLMLTFDCNLRCSYCFEKKVIRKESLEIEMLSNIFTFIKGLKKNGKKIEIELYGGEPLLPKNKELVKKVMLFCEKNDIKNILIISNGVYLNEYIEIFSQYKDLEFYIQITLDGPKYIQDKRRPSLDGKSYYNNVIDNIKKALKSNFNIQIRTNVDKNNIDILDDFYDYLDEEFGLYNNWSSYFTPVHGVNEKNMVDECDVIEIMDKINLANLNRTGGLHLLDYIYGAFYGVDYKILPKYSYCESTRGNYYVFAPDGYIYACTETMGYTKRNIGKFYPEIEYDEIAHLKWVSSNIEENIKCSTCKIKFICGGGCLKEHLDTNADNTDKCKEKFNVINKYFDYIRKEMQYE